jgi:malate synthase
VKELSGEPLMEDRATARIKTAFVRNWLLHHVVSAGQVERLIEEMARLVDSQNADKSGYVPIVTPEMNDPVIQAVRQLVFNPQAYRNSYVEPYLYAAYLRAHSDRKTAGAAVDFMGDWDVAAVVNRAV